MKNSYIRDMRIRFVFIYIATFFIVFTMSNLQYISTIEHLATNQAEKVIDHHLYSDKDLYLSTEKVDLISKSDIVKYSILLQDIPIYMNIDNKIYKLSFSPHYGYYSFIIKPLAAIIFVILAIYLILNRMIKNGLRRMENFKKFLYHYLKNDHIDEKLLEDLRDYDDEICEIALNTSKVMQENIKIASTQKRFLSILEELNEIVLEMSDGFEIIKYNKAWLPIKQNSNNFLNYLSGNNIHQIEHNSRNLKDRKIENIIFIDRLNHEDKYFEVKIVYFEGVFGAIIKNITDMYQQHAEIECVALYDNLTDLPNRALFIDRLNSEINRSKRENEQFALLFFDLNMFQKINDDHGHDVGDVVLIEFSKRVINILRKSDTFARVGGDEFIAIASNIKGLEEVKVIIDKIHLSLNKPFAYKSLIINISASIGVSIFPINGEDADLLILKADKAMYNCKKTKEKYCLYREDL